MKQANRQKTLCRLLVAATVPATVLTAGSAAASTFEVGPGKPYSSLAEVASLLSPGDVVNLHGGATYAPVAFENSGTAAAPIRIQGVRVGGKRPVISGGTNTVALGGSNYVLEGLDITGGSSRCVFHRADNITIRDSVIRDCPGHGLLGADADAGSLTLSYVEVTGSGEGLTRHPIYMATDESAHPGSVFRMEHCYVHDNPGGNAVKTRAERNEIYYNWIDGALYRALELIGPDGQAEQLAREDSDVVGNVLRATQSFALVRVGGDGTGQTFGRFRFVNNTFVMRNADAAVLQAFDSVESVEMHNNAFFAESGGPVRVLRDSDAIWTTGSQVMVGQNNWVPDGSEAPAQWTATLEGANPGFVDALGGDFRLNPNSPLRNKGASAPPSPAAHAFVRPLVRAAFTPPLEELEPLGGATPRVEAGPVDIGAFEHELFTPATPPTPPTPPAAPPKPPSKPPSSPEPGAFSPVVTQLLRWVLLFQPWR